jgi:hypothetical protein
VGADAVADRVDLAELRRGTCFATGRHRECYGRLTVHHVIAQQRIKRVHRSLVQAFRRGQGPRPWSLAKALQDKSNLVVCCFGCHQCVEAGSIRVEPSDLPHGFWAFVYAHGLAGELPRHLVEAAA